MARVSLRDARTWQIFSLGLLLTYGVGILGFDQTPSNIALIIATALGTQWLCARTIANTRFDALSPLITAFSLCDQSQDCEGAWPCRVAISSHARR
jgi:hypothetical protein